MSVRIGAFQCQELLALLATIGRVLSHCTNKISSWFVQDTLK